MQNWIINLLKYYVEKESVFPNNPAPDVSSYGADLEEPWKTVYGLSPLLKQTLELRSHSDSVSKMMVFHEDTIDVTADGP